ncbi:DEAD/DEAH box helicase [Tsuneonella sp. HG222]
MTFTELGLSQPVLQALELKGYDTPTPIQSQAIPTVLTGRDLLGIAQTGTGKTAAFMLPSIDRLIEADKRPGPRQCRMLVLAPTRELAGQIAESAREYARFAHLKVVTVFGGTSVHKNKQDVARGVDILIATPGRLVDLADQRALDLSRVEILVLDEADQMLDLGFIHALRAIVRLLPKQRQTLFFSATMPKAIRELASQYLTDPAQVSVTPQATTAEKVEQQVMFCNAAEKQALLTILLREGLHSKAMDRVLVFTRTKHGADRVVKKLAQAGLKSNAIHGNKSQPQRERALGEFKDGSVRVLVATDIAARGIDVSGVSHVINFELPNVAEQYVHRIGRTARAGATGIALSICAPDEKAYLRDIWKLTKADMENLDLPEGLAAEASKVNAMARQLPSRDQGVERPREQQRPHRPKAVVKAKPRGAPGGQGGERARPQGQGQQQARAQGGSGPQGGQGQAGGQGRPNPNRNRRRNRRTNG